MNWNIFHEWKEQIGTYFMSGREFRNCLAQTTYLKVFRDFRTSHVVLVVKICTGIKPVSPASPAGDTRDTGWIPRLGRSPGVGNGNLLQYSCWENSMDIGANGLQSTGPESWTLLSDSAQHSRVSTWTSYPFSLGPTRNSNQESSYLMTCFFHGETLEPCVDNMQLCEILRITLEGRLGKYHIP